MWRTPVRVHPLFWLVALLLCYQRNIAFGLVLLSTVCLFLVLLVHEFGHALCGRYYGDRGNRIHLYWMGGVCISERQPPGHWPRIFIMLWGPGAGFILGGLAFAALWAVGTMYGGGLNPFIVKETSPLIIWALKTLVRFSLIWGAVNLLPIYPLDGGQVVRELVAWKAPRREHLVYSFAFYAALVLTCLCLGLAFYFSASPWGYFPALFFLILAFSTWQMRRQIAESGGLQEYEEPRQPWEQDADWWKKK